MRQDLVILLIAMHNFKIHLNYYAMNEVEMFEKLSFKIVDNISKETECFNIFDLATILSLFKLMKIPVNLKIDHNLTIISVKSCYFSHKLKIFSFRNASLLFI